MNRSQVQLRDDALAIWQAGVDAVLGDLDAEILVAPGRGVLGDLLGRERERAAGMQAKQPVGIIFRQIVLLARGIHDAPGEVVLLHRTACMGAHLHHQNVLDVKLGADAEQNGGDARGVGVGQLGEIAGAHEHFGFRPFAA